MTDSDDSIIPEPVITGSFLLTKDLQGRSLIVRITSIQAIKTIALAPDKWCVQIIYGHGLVENLILTSANESDAEEDSSVLSGQIETALEKGAL